VRDGPLTERGDGCAACAAANVGRDATSANPPTVDHLESARPFIDLAVFEGVTSEPVMATLARARRERFLRPGCFLSQRVSAEGSSGLRAHVGGGAEREASLGDAIPTRVAHHERDAEVGDHRLSRLEEDVLRLEVAVDYPVRVRVLERVDDGGGDVDGFVDRELLLAVEPRPQRLPIDEGHHVVVQPLGFTRIEQRKEVRVGRLAVTLISERNRSPPSTAPRSRLTLRATWRSWRRSRARYTGAMPPEPISRSIA
jgi:hypothetical protein